MSKRIACIDLGTNAIRFIVYEFFSLERYQVLYKHRAIVRLGEGVFTKGELSWEIIGKVPQILFEYQRQAKAYDVETIRCVATSAVREASNGKLFLEEVEKQTGLHFQALSGIQEARILCLALQWNRPAPRNLIYAGIDIGGGSTEVWWYHHLGFIDGISMPIGTVRVLEHFCDFPLTDQRITNIRNFVQVNAKVFQDRQGAMIPHRVFGVSGLLLALFELMEKTADDPIQFPELESFIAGHSNMTPALLQRKYGMEKNRSEILIPGCVILSQLMVMGGFRQIYQAEVGLRDGLAIEAMIEQYGDGGQTFGQLSGSRLREAKVDWAYGLLEKYAGDLTHAKSTELLVTRMFQKLSVFGKIPDSDDHLVMLRVAAILYNIGHFVSYIDHHVHSRYIISHSQSPYFSDREIAWIGLLAYFHRKSMTFLSQDLFVREGFEPSEYAMFSASLALLKVADALDQQHRQLMTLEDFKEQNSHYELWMTTNHQESLSEEIRVFDIIAPAFEQVFGKSLVLKVLPASALH